MFDISTLGLAVDTSKVKVAVVDIDKLVESAKRAEAAADKLESTNKTLGQSFSTAGQQANALAGRVLGLLAAYVSLQKAVSFLRDSTLLAARYETLGATMYAVGQRTGYTVAQLDRYEQALRKTGITMNESRQSVVRMIQANMDLENATKLARIAQDAAVIGNINSSEAFGRLVYGIQSAQVEVLRTIGLNTNFEESYKKLAQELHKSVGALTEKEKVQARVNAVMEAGTRIEGAYVSAMSTAGKQLNSFTRYIEDFKVEFGKAFGPYLTELVFAASERMKKWTEIVKSDEFQASLARVGETATKMFNAIMDLIEDVIRWWQKHGEAVTTSGKNIYEALAGVIKDSLTVVETVLGWIWPDESKVSAATSGYKTIGDTIGSIADKLNSVPKEVWLALLGAYAGGKVGGGSGAAIGGSLGLATSSIKNTWSWLTGDLGTWDYLRGYGPDQKAAFEAALKKAQGKGSSQTPGFTQGELNKYFGAYDYDGYLPTDKPAFQEIMKQAKTRLEIVKQGLDLNRTSVEQLSDAYDAYIATLGKAGKSESEIALARAQADKDIDAVLTKRFAALNKYSAEQEKATTARLKLEHEVELQVVGFMEDGVAKRIALYEAENTAAYGALAEKLTKTSLSWDQQTAILEDFLRTSDKKFQDGLLNRTKYTKEWVEREIKALKELGLDEEELWKEQVDVYAKYLRERENETRRHIDNLKVLLKNDMASGFEVALAEMMADFKSFQEFMYEGWRATGEEFKALFGDVFYSGITDGLEGILDTFQDFGKSLLRIWTRIIGEMIYQWMTSQLVKGLGININMGGVGMGMPSPSTFAAFAEIARTGGLGGAAADAVNGYAGSLYAFNEGAGPIGAMGGTGTGFWHNVGSVGWQGMAGGMAGGMAANFLSPMLFKQGQYSGMGGGLGSMAGGILAAGLGFTGPIGMGIGALLGGLGGNFLGGLFGGGKDDTADREADAKRFYDIAKNLLEKVGDSRKTVDVDKYLEAINAAHRSDNRVSPDDQWALYNQLKDNDKLPWWAGNPDQVGHTRQFAGGTEWGQPQWMRYQLFGTGGGKDEVGTSGMAQWFGGEGEGGWGGAWEEFKEGMEEFGDETLNKLGESIANIKEGIGMFGVSLEDLMDGITMSQLQSGEWEAILRDRLQPASLLARMEDELRAQGLDNLTIATQKQAAVLDTLLGSFDMSREETDKWIEQLLKSNADVADQAAKMDEYNRIVDELKKLRAGEEEKARDLIERARKLREELGLGESAFSKMEEAVDSLAKTMNEQVVPAFEDLIKKLIEAMNKHGGESAHYGGVVGLRTYHRGGIALPSFHAGGSTGLQPDEFIAKLIKGEVVWSPQNVQDWGGIANVDRLRKLKPQQVFGQLLNGGGQTGNISLEVNLQVAGDVIGEESAVRRIGEKAGEIAINQLKSALGSGYAMVRPRQLRMSNGS